jgi:hypothetical protein
MMPVIGRDDEMVQITVAKQFASYFAGEKAAFLPEQAQAIVARGVGTSTGTTAKLTGGAIADAVALVAALKAIADGGFAITIHGTARQVGPINFAAIAAAPDAAALIDAAMGTAAICAWTGGNHFLITGAATGPAATIGFATPPASGTNIATTCALTSAAGAALTQGT